MIFLVWLFISTIAYHLIGDIYWPRVKKQKEEAENSEDTQFHYASDNYKSNFDYARKEQKTKKNYEEISDYKTKAYRSVDKVIVIVQHSLMNASRVGINEKIIVVSLPDHEMSQET